MRKIYKIEVQASEFFCENGLNMGLGFSAIESHTIGNWIVRLLRKFKRKSKVGRPVEGPPDREGQWGVSQTAEVSGERQWGGLLNFSEGKIA